MTMKRIMLSILIITIICMVQGLTAHAGPSIESSGPVLGKWEFTGKDNQGVSWTGTLVVQKLDTNRFDADKYHSIFSLELESANAGRGFEAPCRWQPGNREVSASVGDITYAAILSPDGKSLTQGTWTHPKKGFGTSTVTIINTGVWSAKFTAQ
jgi:hypothetical protein